jgi:hypothetical protein
MAKATGGGEVPFGMTLGRLAAQQLTDAHIILAQGIARSDEQDHGKNHEAKVNIPRSLCPESFVDPSGQVDKNQCKQVVSVELVELVMNVVEHAVSGNSLALREKSRSG